MIGEIVLLTAWLILAPETPADPGVISGVIVNGSAGGSPIPNAVIVLRAGAEGAFIPVAETVSDDSGYFELTGLPVEGSVLYLPGVNHQGVHYPGQRVQLRSDRPSAKVRLTAYNAQATPSPLVCRRHEIHVRLAAQFLEVEEIVLIDNPSLTTYVGPSVEGQSPVTLRLSLPHGLDNVTFDREFHGRNFSLQDDELTTDVPFRPGTQELKFRYRLPAENRHTFIRHLDRPTHHVCIRVEAADPRRITCNLASPQQVNGQVTFERASSDEPLPAGFAIQLQLGSLPIGFVTYARWVATGLLAVMMIGTLRFARGGTGGRAEGNACS